MYICDYCGEEREKRIDPCPGCGARKSKEKNQLRSDEWEFMYNGYFVRVMEGGALGGQVYYFYRGQQLITSFRVGLIELYNLQHAYGIKPGERWTHIIWDIFERIMRNENRSVQIFNDPEPRVIEVNIWHYKDWINRQPKAYTPMAYRLDYLQASGSVIVPDNRRIPIADKERVRRHEAFHNGYSDPNWEPG